ncbi:MAG: UvrD-helicase domain-containing protein, partial [Ferruginibacter sp.]|nr:UvrD-helicase domain-containing protein [Cytophagales bacterium]
RGRGRLRYRGNHPSAGRANVPENHPQYSDFAVCTIDSFVNRIVSAFTEELDIPFNYEVDLDTHTLLNAAIDRLLDKVGREEFAPLTEAMEAFALEKAEEGRNWNRLPDELADFGRNLFNEQVFASVGKVRDLNTQDFLRLRRQLSFHNAEVERCLREKAHDALRLMDAHGLTAKDFFQGDRGIGGFWTKWAGKIDLAAAPNAYVQKTIREDAWYGGKALASQRAAIEAIKAGLAECFHCIEGIRTGAGAKYVLFQQLMPAFYKLSVLNQIREELKDIQRDKNTIHISEFNKTILDVVLREPVPFIYERMGERYNHILIDEFQDTSVLQWNNLLPLIENSLGSAHFNLVVGDAKQAIYRWRGGEMEQIVYLHQQQPEKLLAMNRTHHQLVDERYASIRPHLTSARLNTNYRSASEIIAFNNAFFRSVANDHPYDLLGSIYDQHFEQELPADARHGGHVQVTFLDKTGSEAGETSYDEETMRAVLRTIEEAQRAGYDLKDIAILNRKNEHGRRIAHFLKERGFDIISQDSLSLRFSGAVNLLIAILKVVHIPDNRLAKYEALYLFHRIVRRQIPDNPLNERIRAVVESGDAGLFYDYFAGNGYPVQFRLQQANLYEITEKLIDTFRLFDQPQQAEYLFRFLDVVLEFSVKQTNQLADFLGYWEQKKESLSINTPRNLNAVTLTSIHKAKGLEYPVVILPFADWSLTPVWNSAMWVDLEEVDFDELTVGADPLANLPGKKLHAASVQIVKSLVNTAVHPQYIREWERTFIESLNMLYVALTRPKDRLYVLARNYDARNSGYRDCVSHLFYRFLQEKGLWQEGVSAYVWQEGVPKPPSPGENAADSVLELGRIIVHDQSDRIRLSRSASRLFDLDTFEKHRDWGRKLYEIIIRLRHAGEVDKVLRSLVGEGLFDKSEAVRLKERVAQIISHPRLLPLFAEGQRVDLGREILSGGALTDGALLGNVGSKSREVIKPDRVVWQGSRPTIVDYKTGSPETWHREQMERYAALFARMGFRVAEKWLVYLEEGNVVGG